MRTMCSREIFTKKCRQQPIFDSNLKGAWHYNHVTFTPIAKNFRLYCRLIYMLSILCVRLTIKVKVEIPESFKVEWYPPPPKKKTGSSHLKFLIRVFQNERFNRFLRFFSSFINNNRTLRKCYLFSYRYKNFWDIGIYLKLFRWYVRKFVTFHMHVLVKALDI